MPFRHTGTITLEAERLLLRRFQLNDADSMLNNWIADPVVQGNYGEPTYERKESISALIKDWITNYENQDQTFYRWAIILKENDENIGQIAFCCMYTESQSAEIEYCISQAHWGKGYAAEALRTVLTYSFTTPEFNKLEAFHRIENPNSGKVLQKVGMKTVSTVRRFENENKKPKGEICYALTKEEFYML